MPEEDEYPDECLVDFDMRLIDLFAKMERKHRRIQDLIREEYFRVKELLSCRPGRLELFTHMDADVYQLVIDQSKNNIFKKYLDFLHGLGELTEEENVLFNGIGREFIQLIETTNMTKVYRMPDFMREYKRYASAL